MAFVDGTAPAVVKIQDSGELCFKSSSSTSLDGKHNTTTLNSRNKLGHGNVNTSDSEKIKTQHKTQRWTEYLADRQKTFSVKFIATLYMLNQIPSLQPYTQKFLHIQYLSDNGLARIGVNDVYFVIYCVVLLVFVRAFLMEYAFRPFALNSGQVKSKKALIRFSEQAWSLFYYTTSFLFGMYLLVYQSDYLYSVKNVWVGWPHYELTVLMKSYYLIQFSCWLSQIYVLNVEERRKDHYQMFSHHIVTCLLVSGSYYYYYTRVGHMILVLMDVGDIFLAMAKILKYLGFSTACDATFVVFMISWIVLRHGLFNYVTWSAAYEGPKLIIQQCYYDSDGEIVRCFTPAVHWTLVSMLCVLQAMALIWFYMIIRVVMKILKAGSAEDPRSDDEDD